MAMSLQLKRVDKIGQKYKNIVNGFVKQVQSELPSDNIYYNIVDLIKYMILLYYHAIFDSNLLTETEQDKLLDLFQKYNEEIVNNSWISIFDSAKDGFERDTFIDKVHDKQNILLLIKLKGDTIIGGYTKAG